MFDFVCIFTTGGVVLWSKAFCEIKLDVLNTFIKNILLVEKTGQAQYNFAEYVLKWKVQNDLKLVFAIIYKEILQLAFVEELLDLIRFEFVTKIYPQLMREGDVYMTLPNNFDQHFQVLWQRWELKSKEMDGPKKMKTFDQTKKAKKAKENKGGDKGGSPSKTGNSGLE